MKTHIEQKSNKCRLHINDLHTEWYNSKQELYDRIDDGLGLYKTIPISGTLKKPNGEVSQQKGILTLSQTTGTYQITLL